MSEQDEIAEAHSQTVLAAEEAARDPFKPEVTALCDEGYDADWVNTGGNCMMIQCALPNGDEVWVNGIFYMDEEAVQDNLIDRDDLTGFVVSLHRQAEDGWPHQLWIDGPGFDDDGGLSTAAEIPALVEAVKAMADISAGQIPAGVTFREEG